MGHYSLEPDKPIPTVTISGVMPTIIFNSFDFIRLLPCDCAHIKRKNSQQCDHLSSHLCANLLSQSTTYTCKTISRKDRETTMFCKALIVRLFLPDAFYQLHCHDQTSATERMYNWNKQSTRPRRLLEIQIFRLWLDR